MDLSYGVEKYERKYGCKQRRRLADGLKRYRKSIIYAAFQHIDCYQLGQLGKYNSSDKPRQHGDDAYYYSFPKYDQADVFLSHPQYIVQTKFFFSLLYQEGIGVEEKYHRKSAYHITA